MYRLQFDGLFRSFDRRPNSPIHCGFMCYGWIILHSGTVIARGHGGYARSRDATSIAAEYMALIEGLEALSDMSIGNERVEVLGDAKSIIDQMQGVAAVTSPRIRIYYRKARRLANLFPRLEWFWTPRKYNREADALTRRAIEQIYTRHDCDRLVNDLMHPQKKAPGRLVPLINLRVHQATGVLNSTL